MVSANLQIVFAALGVGLIVLLLLGVVYWLLIDHRKTLARWIAGLPLRPQGAVGGLVFLLLAYSLGLIVQDVTDHLTDSDREYGSRWSMPALQARLLGSEGHHRFLSLFRRGGRDGSYRPSSLGRELLGNTGFVHTEVEPRSVEEWDFVEGTFDFVARRTSDLCNTFDRSGVEVAEGLANRLYYPAKNWVYKQPNLFQELEVVQQRIDFFRSVFLVLTWTIVVVLVILAARLAAGFLYVYLLVGLLVVGSDILIPIWLMIGLTCCFVDEYWPLLSRFVRSNRVMSRAIATLLVLILFSALARLGYSNAEHVFNERAYGYYSTYLSETRQVLEAKGERLPESAALVEPSRPVHPQLGAIAWTRESRAYRDACHQIYDVAYREVERIAEDMIWTADRPPAIVMDLDETVLDNSAFNAQRVAQDLLAGGYEAEAWCRWVVAQSSAVDLVPGARKFIRRVRELRARVGNDRIPIELVFISNRRLGEPPALVEGRATFELLKRLRLVPKAATFENHVGRLLLLRDGEDSKERRRVAAARRFTIIAEFGDNLADFSRAYEYDDQGAGGERAVVADQVDRWGPRPVGGAFESRWFVLPNLLYGDWVHALGKPIRDYRSAWVEHSAEFQALLGQCESIFATWIGSLETCSTSGHRPRVAIDIADDGLRQRWEEAAGRYEHKIELVDATTTGEFVAIIVSSRAPASSEFRLSTNGCAAPTAWLVVPDPRHDAPEVTRDPDPREYCCRTAREP